MKKLIVTCALALLPLGVLPSHSDAQPALCDIPGWRQRSEITQIPATGVQFINFPGTLTGPYFLTTLENDDVVVGDARVVMVRRSETLVMVQGPPGTWIRTVLCVRSY